MSDWFENENLWQETETALFGAARFEAARNETEQILALSGNEPKRVLDLCCGPGRYSVPFAERGLRVTGVDRTMRYLERAREYAAERGVSLELVESDMRAFVRENAFDLALSLYTSFGYFEDKQDDRQVLAHLARSLTPGGKLVMDLIGREVVARIFQATSSRLLDDGTLVVERRKIFGNFERIETEWFLLKDGRYHIHTFRLFVYAGTELRDMLLDAGFSKVDLYGSFDARPYDQAALRLIAVATK